MVVRRLAEKVRTNPNYGPNYGVPMPTSNRPRKDAKCRQHLKCRDLKLHEDENLPVLNFRFGNKRTGAKHKTTSFSNLIPTNLLSHSGFFSGVSFVLFFF
jgi:hypothetical protein